MCRLPAPTKLVHITLEIRTVPMYFPRTKSNFLSFKPKYFAAGNKVLLLQCCTSKPSNAELTLNQVYYTSLQLSTKRKRAPLVKTRYFFLKKPNNKPKKHTIFLKGEIWKVFHFIKLIPNKTHSPVCTNTVIHDYCMKKKKKKVNSNRKSLQASTEMWERDNNV